MMNALFVKRDTELDKTRREGGGVSPEAHRQAEQVFIEREAQRRAEEERKKMEWAQAVEERRREHERMEAEDLARRQPRIEAIRAAIEEGTPEAYARARATMRLPDDVTAQMRGMHAQWRAKNAPPPDIEVMEHEESGTELGEEERRKLEALPKKPGVLGNRARRAFMQSGTLPPGMSEAERNALANAALQRTREAFQRRTSAEPQTFDQAG